MAIDLMEVRDDVITLLREGAKAMVDLPPHDYLMVVGAALLGVGSILAANEVWKWWRKGKGYRMILRERRDKMDRELSDGITDLILTLETSGKWSRKEADAEYQRISKQLNLPDLIPAKRRARIVKQEIKGRLNKSEKKKPPANPKTGKPKPLRQRIGTFANQFWRARA